LDMCMKYTDVLYQPALTLELDTFVNSMTKKARLTIPEVVRTALDFYQLHPDSPNYPVYNRYPYVLSNINVTKAQKDFVKSRHCKPAQTVRNALFAYKTHLDITGNLFHYVIPEK